MKTIHPYHTPLTEIHVIKPETLMIGYNNSIGENAQNADAKPQPTFDEEEAWSDDTTEDTLLLHYDIWDD